MKNKKRCLDNTLSIRMPDEMHAAIQRTATELSLKPADIIRLCVHAQLDALDKTGQWTLIPKIDSSSK